MELFFVFFLFWTLLEEPSFLDPLGVVFKNIRDLIDKMGECH